VNIIKVDYWGLKRLAYLVKKQEKILKDKPAFSEGEKSFIFRTFCRKNLS